MSLQNHYIVSTLLAHCYHNYVVFGLLFIVTIMMIVCKILTMHNVTFGIRPQMMSQSSIVPFTKDVGQTQVISVKLAQEYHNFSTDQIQQTQDNLSKCQMRQKWPI